MVGDLILEVNGQDIRKLAYSDVAFLLKTLPQGKVNIKIGRFKTSSVSFSFTNNSGMNSVINLSSSASSQQGSKQPSRRNSITAVQTSSITAENETIVSNTSSINVVAKEENSGNSSSSGSKFSTFKPCLKK
jgi:hypothetical protein